MTKIRVMINGVEVEVETDDSYRLIIELQKLAAIVRDIVTAVKVKAVEVRKVR